MLDFHEVSVVNRSRAERWHEGFPTDDWNLADWSNAMCGEAGEAANLVKKLRRHEVGLGSGQRGPEALTKALAKELADVFIYLDLVATKAGIDLERAIIDKFNEVSEARGFPERLPLGAR